MTQYRVKDGRDLVDAEEIKKRWKEYTEELEELLKKKKKKILMNLMVWLVTQSQTFWSMKSSGP